MMKFITSATGPAARAWATYLGGRQPGVSAQPAGEWPRRAAAAGHHVLAQLPHHGRGLEPHAFGAGRWWRRWASTRPYLLRSGADLVLTRLSASGGRLRASTYLGGTGTDGLLDAAAPAPRLRHNYGDAFRGDLALDPQGNVYVASVTSSTDFPGAGGGQLPGRRLRWPRHQPRFQL